MDVRKGKRCHDLDGLKYPFEVFWIILQNLVMKWSFSEENLKIFVSSMTGL